MTKISEKYTRKKESIRKCSLKRKRLVFVICSPAVVGVKQMVCSASARHTEIFLVKLLDGRVVVRFAYKGVTILCVEGFCSLCSDVNPASYLRKLQRLSAAVYTAAGAGHNLYEVEFFSCSYRIHKLSGIAKPVGYGSAKLKVACLNCRYLDSLKSSDIVLLEAVGR